MIEKIKGSLVSKITLVFLVVAIVPYLMASLFFFQSSKNSLFNEVLKGLERETSLIRDNLDARLSLLQGNATAWADLAVMSDIISDDLDKRIAIALEGLKRDYRLAGDIYAINSEGTIIASSNAIHRGKKISNGWLGKVLNGESVTLDNHPSEIDGHASVSFAAPIQPHFTTKGPIGALLLEYHVKGLIDLSLSGDMSHIALLNDRREIITTFPEAGPFREGDIKLSGEKIDRKDKADGYILAYAKSRGYLAFKGFGWTVVTAVSEKRALDPVKGIEQISFGIAFLGIALILVLVMLFARRTVKPLKDLSLAANRIAETKDFSAAVSYKTTDEVGQLAKAFNDMVEEVRSHMMQMQEMEEGLRRADRLSALGELSAGMAHEIKNPLGVIRSSADMLKKRLDSTEQEGLLASAIAEESVRLSQLLEAFLQFARPSQPQFSLCHLNAIIGKTLILLESEISKNNIELIKKLDSSLPAIYSDENQLHQVLVNIIINALQAMPEGGRLEIITRMIPSPGQKIELTISDTGAGIAPDDNENIFNPFFTTKSKGTGLGLSIVQRIVTGLGGEVKVEVNKPRGTVFKILVPLSQND